MSERPGPYIRDTPHTQLSVGVRQQRDDISRTAGIPFEGCNVSTVVLGLNEFDLRLLDDGKLSHSMETWPIDVRAGLRDELVRFGQRNGGATVMAVTQAISPAPRAFVMAIHWKPKAAAVTS